MMILLVTLVTLIIIMMDPSVTPVELVIILPQALHLKPVALVINSSYSLILIFLLKIVSVVVIHALIPQLVIHALQDIPRMLKTHVPSVLLTNTLLQALQAAVIAQSRNTLQLAHQPV